MYYLQVAERPEGALLPPMEEFEVAHIGMNYKQHQLSSPTGCRTPVARPWCQEDLATEGLVMIIATPP